MTTTSERAEPRTRRERRFRDSYGPWAVVTGASSGIGRALAVHLAANGLDLVVVARRHYLLHELADDLRTAHDVAVRPVSLDLSDRDATRQLVDATTDLDVGLLVAAAGFGTSGPFLAGDLDDEIGMIDVNCSAVYAHTHHFADRFAQRGRGGIVLLSSIVGFQGMPLAANYAATKAYVQTLGEALHRELAPVGVDVLTVAPGPTHSAFAERAGMQMKGADTPERLAGPILDALGKKATLLPSPRSKLLRWGVMTMPLRSGRVRIMGAVMKGITAAE